MKYRLSVRNLAEDDIAEAFKPYETEQEGLGRRFHDEVAVMLGRITENPRLYPNSEMSRYRKTSLSVFPFCIYYCIIQDLIAVIAVHDARRDPQRWQERAH